MIQHIKKLFLAMIVLTCFTCFQRADYNLPMFAFAFFLWDYKHPNVHIKPCLAPEDSAVLPDDCHLDNGFRVADLLGSHLEFRRVPAQRIIRHFFFRVDPFSHKFPLKSTPNSIQLAIIIILYLFDP